MAVWQCRKSVNFGLRPWEKLLTDSDVLNATHVKMKPKGYIFNLWKKTREIGHFRVGLPSVSKRVLVQNILCGNAEFCLHVHFRMKGLCTKTHYETEVKVNVFTRLNVGFE